MTQNKQTSILRKIGETLECEIGGCKTILERIRGRYIYDRDKCKCPVCGGLGTPWGGLFHCEFEGYAGHKAIISTGQCFKVIEIDGKKIK